MSLNQHSAHYYVVMLSIANKQLFKLLVRFDRYYRGIL